MRKLLLIPVLLVAIFASSCGGGVQPKRISIESLSIIPATTTTSTSTSTTTTQPSPPPTTKTTSRANGSHSHYPVVPGGDLWARIRACENGGSYDKGNSPGYFGAYQFSPSTWATASSHAQGGEWGSATPAQQEAAKDWLFTHADPYHQWPVCYPRALRG